MVCSSEVGPESGGSFLFDDRSSKPPVRAFLSYSRSSEGATQGITLDLKACGIGEVWWDKDLIGAQPWWDTILHQIRLADVVVCLLDGGIRDSVAVRREYQYALDLGKPLLPLLLSDDIEISTLPVELSGNQYVDCRAGNSARMEKLREAIRHLPEPPLLPDPLPEPPDIPRKEIDFLTDRINSFEPLNEVDQVMVVSELRYLAARPDAKQREFAQESLETLRNRRELLHRVSQEIEELQKGSRSETKFNQSKFFKIAYLGVAVAIAAAVIVFLKNQENAITDNTTTELHNKPETNSTENGSLLGKKVEQITGTESKTENMPEFQGKGSDTPKAADRPTSKSTNSSIDGEVGLCSAGIKMPSCLGTDLIKLREVYFGKSGRMVLGTGYYELRGAPNGVAINLAQYLQDPTTANSNFILLDGGAINFGSGINVTVFQDGLESTQRLSSLSLPMGTFVSVRAQPENELNGTTVATSNGAFLIEGLDILDGPRDPRRFVISSSSGNYLFTNTDATKLSVPIPQYARRWIDKATASSGVDLESTILNSENAEPTSGTRQWSGSAWIEGFSVFAEQDFSVCGFKNFTLKGSHRVGGSTQESILVRSRDRSIPDRPTMGFSKNVNAGVLTELMPNCVVQIDHVQTSGVSRFRVRTKGR